MEKWRTVIGLEIHAELLTKTKIFCNCSAEFGGAPNTRCCASERNACKRASCKGETGFQSK